MLWIALHLPRLPLEAQPVLADASGPAVVAEQQRVLLANGPAQDLGIEPGMGLSTARSRAARLVCAPRDPVAERALLEQLGLVALRFSPRLVLMPEGLALEVQASLRLFGGERRLWDLLRADVQAWGLSSGWAAAPTCEAASLLAWMHARSAARPPSLPLPPRTRRPDRAAQWLDALALLPVLSAWSAPLALIELLQGLGLGTLGDLRRLPREGLIRRGAQELLERLDRAYGRASQPQVFHEPAPSFEQALELPESTDRIDLILMALSRLMLALGGWLTASHRAAQVIGLRLIHDSPRRESHPDTCLSCRLAAPQADSRVLLALFRERLERQELPAPVRRLALRLEVHTPRHPQTESFEWAHTAAQNLEDSRARLLDRLQARLGPERVLFLQAQPDHRPERASSWEPVGWATPSPGPIGHLPRPCWLLPQPEPLTERQGQLWLGGHRLILRSRPERIEAGWFDEDPTCRDYHIAQTADARLAWVYRTHRADPSAWFLHGWFG